MLSKTYIEDYLEKFKSSHKGLEDTKFKVFSTMEEAFPHHDKSTLKEISFAGAYYPASNLVLVIAENNRNIKELNKTIRHEVFGHLALNRLSEVDKYDLLQTIANAPEDSYIGKYRAYLAMTSYSALKDQPLMLAEEVFAHVAEQSFRPIEHFKSIPDPTKVNSKEDLLNIIDAIKNGIHHGVLEQKIFPKSNHEQFKAVEKDKAMNTKDEISSNVYTIRQGRIKEISKENLNSWETSFESKKEAILYQARTGSSHNLTKEEKEILHKEIERLAKKKGYNLEKDDQHYTLINKKTEERITRIDERHIFSTIKNSPEIFVNENRLDDIDRLGNLGRFEDLKKTVDNEIDKTYSDIKYWQHEHDYYADPKQGNDQERSRDALDEIHSKENYLESLYKVAQKYDVAIEHTRHDTSSHIQIEKHNERSSIVNKQAEKTVVSASHAKEVQAPTKMNYFQKVAKEFRRQNRQTPQKVRGGYSR
jgi:hypothetical protein